MTSITQLWSGRGSYLILTKKTEYICVSIFFVAYLYCSSDDDVFGMRLSPERM